MLVITLQRGSQPRVQHHPVAIPEDSALYPLRCFSAPFATDAETFGYLQVQHLFAYSFNFYSRHPCGQRQFHNHRLMKPVSHHCYMEEYIGIEPAFSPWRGEVLAVIRYLHRIAGEPSFSPAMMLV